MLSAQLALRPSAGNSWRRNPLYADHLGDGLTPEARHCFVGDDRWLLLPAFGSDTGGRDVFDPAIASLFKDGFRATLRARRPSAA